MPSGTSRDTSTICSHLALADDVHDGHGEHKGAGKVAAALEQRGEEDAQHDDHIGHGHALILQRVQGAYLHGQRVGVLQGAHQLEDGLDEQDGRKDQHAHDHDAREGGSLHVGVGYLRETIGLEPGPDAQCQEEDGTDQVGESHCLGFLLIQMEFPLSKGLKKRGRHKT